MCDSHDDSIADLHRVLGVLLDVDLGGVEDDALHDVVVSTGRAEARLAAAKARLLAEWDRRKLWRSNGALRANVRLGNELGISPETAFVEMRRARKLQSMPHTLEAFARGDLSVDHVEMLCRANAGDLADHFPDSEKALVEACVTQRFAAAARTIKYWRQYTDPAGADFTGEQMRERRKLWWRRLPCGSISGGFRLDPVSAAIFTHELNHCERQLYRGEMAEHGEATRAVGQRRADALVEMATRSKTTPSNGKRPRPLYTVLVGYETFAGRLCELDDGTVLAPGQLTGGLSQADIERVVFDGPDRVLSVSTRRRFTGAVRRAIQVRDRHCQHPSGCDVPAPDCDVDHIVPWPISRETSLANGRIACPGHNRKPEINAPWRATGAEREAGISQPLATRDGHVHRGRPPPGG